MSSRSYEKMDKQMFNDVLMTLNRNRLKTFEFQTKMEKFNVDYYRYQGQDQERQLKLSLLEYALRCNNQKILKIFLEGNNQLTELIKICITNGQWYYIDLQFSLGKFQNLIQYADSVFKDCYEITGQNVINLKRVSKKFGISLCQITIEKQRVDEYYCPERSEPDVIMIVVKSLSQLGKYYLAVRKRDSGSATSSQQQQLQENKKFTIEKQKILIDQDTAKKQNDKVYDPSNYSLQNLQNLPSNSSSNQKSQKCDDCLKTLICYVFECQHAICESCFLYKQQRSNLIDCFFRCSQRSYYTSGQISKQPLISDSVISKYFKQIKQQSQEDEKQIKHTIRKNIILNMKCQACLTSYHTELIQIEKCDHLICKSCFGEVHQQSCPVCDKNNQKQITQNQPNLEKIYNEEDFKLIQSQSYTYHTCQSCGYLSKLGWVNRLTNFVYCDKCKLSILAHSKSQTGSKQFPIQRPQINNYNLNPDHEAKKPKCDKCRLEKSKLYSSKKCIHQFCDECLIDQVQNNTYSILPCLVYSCSRYLDQDEVENWILMSKSNFFLNIKNTFFKQNGSNILFPHFQLKAQQKRQIIEVQCQNCGQGEKLSIEDGQKAEYFKCKRCKEATCLIHDLLQSVCFCLCDQCLGEFSIVDEFQVYCQKCQVYTCKACKKIDRKRIKTCCETRKSIQVEKQPAKNDDENQKKMVIEDEARLPDDQTEMEEDSNPEYCCACHCLIINGDKLSVPNCKHFICRPCKIDFYKKKSLETSKTEKFKSYFSNNYTKSSSNLECTFCNR